MTVRFANTLAPEDMRRLFRTARSKTLWLRSWNIAPQQAAPIIMQDYSAGLRRLDLRYWGFVPSWAHNMEKQPANARADNVVESGFFRAAFRSRRCIVPATAYYLWGREGTERQPYAVKHENDDVLAMAGIWEEWHHDGDTLRSFCIITTEADASLRHITDRMPVLIARHNWEKWLDSPASLASTLMTGPTETALKLCRVSTSINSKTVNRPDLLDPLDN